jgi:anthranilate synthase/aminodeoxychorismate synthase-like glutamine amidotransferase
MIVVLDNRDSFVFNLARYFHLLGCPALVVPSHEVSVADIERLAPRGIVISPGPCTPLEAGCSLAAVRAFRGRVPLLGVCLGHQAIGQALGGKIVRAREPVHGRTSPMHHDGVNLFAGIPSPFPAARYHSLVIERESLPESLSITAVDDEGTIMAIEDRGGGLYGVQFHPESILTRHGFALLANFLDLAGIPRVRGLPESEGTGPSGDPAPAGDGPVVTF